MSEKKKFALGCPEPSANGPFFTSPFSVWDEEGVKEVLALAKTEGSEDAAGNAAGASPRGAEVGSTRVLLAPNFALKIEGVDRECSKIEDFRLEEKPFGEQGATQTRAEKANQQLGS
jgi:hypothetical protein